MLPFEQLTIAMIKDIISNNQKLEKENIVLVTMVTNNVIAHKKEVEALNETIDNIKSERKNHIDIIDYLRNEVGKLTAQLQKCNSKLLRTEDKLEMELMEIDGLKWDNDRLEKENIALKKEIEALRKENIGLKDDKKAMSQIMDERAEQSAQTVRDLNETIDKLQKHSDWSKGYIQYWETEYKESQKQIASLKAQNEK